MPVMFQGWRTLTFAHWAYDPADVQALLPPGLEVDALDGTAWVGLVLFRMHDVRLPQLPAVPWLSIFPETNVRTYVRGPDAKTGIWFMSLDAARLAAVTTGRLVYGLRYCWSRMHLAAGPDRASYSSRRLWPAPRGSSCRLAVDVGNPLREQRRLDDWLTARYRLYTRIAGRLAAAQAEHPPWRLRAATLVHLDEDLLSAAGLPARQGHPLLHYSDGTDVRIGRWRFLG